MRFAVLGLNDTTQALAQAALAAGHQVTAAYAADPGTAGGSIEQLSGAAWLDDWQALLGSRLAEAVIVGQSREELRLEQLRTLIQAGIPLQIGRAHV